MNMNINIYDNIHVHMSINILHGMSIVIICCEHIVCFLGAVDDNLLIWQRACQRATDLFVVQQVSRYDRFSLLYTEDQFVSVTQRRPSIDVGAISQITTNSKKQFRQIK